MAESITAYPLSWPTGWKRTPSHNIRRSRFGTWRNPPPTFKTVEAVQEELRMLGALGVIISTNLELRNDGLPRASAKTPQDAGAAVYFTLNKKPRVLACDRWLTVGENLWAIVKHIEALRGQERWGVGTLDQAFTGYAALPERAGNHWTEVLGLSRDATAAEIESKSRSLVKRLHPDLPGGNADEFRRVIQAREEALAEVAPTIPF